MTPPLVVDFDDFHEGNHRLDRMYELKKINPLFRATLFAVPALGSDGFWSSLPRWLELAVHGWLHPDPHECAEWTKERMVQLMDEPVVRKHFRERVQGAGLADQRRLLRGAGRA